MAKNIMAILLMSIVVVAALQFSTAEKKIDLSNFNLKAFFDSVATMEQRYKSCSETCGKECIAKGDSNNLCKSLCGNYCFEKTNAENVKIDPAFLEKLEKDPAFREKLEKDPAFRENLEKLNKRV